MSLSSMGGRPRRRGPNLPRIVACQWKSASRAPSLVRFRCAFIRTPCPQNACNVAVVRHVRRMGGSGISSSGMTGVRQEDTGPSVVRDFGDDRGALESSRPGPGPPSQSGPSGGDHVREVLASGITDFTQWADAHRLELRVAGALTIAGACLGCAPCAWVPALTCRPCHDKSALWCPAAQPLWRT